MEDHSDQIIERTPDDEKLIKSSDEKKTDMSKKSYLSQSAGKSNHPRAQNQISEFNQESHDINSNIHAAASFGLCDSDQAARGDLSHTMRRLSKAMESDNDEDIDAQIIGSENDDQDQ